jgi:predicted Zn-dependent peptidase
MSEIKRLATDGPTAEEMEKLHNGLRNDEARSRQSSLFRAQRIAEFALFDGDPNLFNTEFDRYLSVTPAQIKDAVGRLLVTDNHSLLEIIPAKPKAPPASPATSGELQPVQTSPEQPTGPAASASLEPAKPEPPTRP